MTPPFFKFHFMDLGSAIKELRLQKGIKQNLFAQQCDISAAYLSQIENNLKEPNISTIRIICENLNIPVPILFFLAIDNNDIDPSKQRAFEILVPPIKSMINEFFRHPDK